MQTFLWTLVAMLLASLVYPLHTRRWTTITLTIPGVVLLAALVLLLFGSY